jgi:sigma-B regulation protein RsbQ
MTTSKLSAAEILKRNNVKVTGRGDTVMLFAHGFGCDQNMWRYLTPAFEENYRCVLFDYVGSGKSDLKAYDAERYGSLEGYAQDVIEICEALDLQDVIFVGHSVSSMVGVLAAKMRPELFAHLILIGPSASYINDEGYHGGFEREDIAGLLDLMDKNYIGWANYLAPVIMKNGDRSELSAELEASFCSTDPKIARRFAEATFYADNRNDLKHVKTPTLIIQCADDAIAPVTVGEFVNHEMENSTLEVIDASGHCPHMSHPELTIETMKAYLAPVHAE